MSACAEGVHFNTPLRDIAAEMVRCDSCYLRWSFEKFVSIHVVMLPDGLTDEFVELVKEFIVRKSLEKECEGNA